VDLPLKTTRTKTLIFSREIGNDLHSSYPELKSKANAVAAVRGNWLQLGVVSRETVLGSGFSLGCSPLKASSPLLIYMQK